MAAKMLPFYLALDFDKKKHISSWASWAKEHRIGLKVGLEAYTAYGPKLVESLVKKGHKVFLDLKLYDIPNTVIRTVKIVEDLGAERLTIHALCNDEVWSAVQSLKHPRPYAVTVLTSFNDQDWAARGFSRSVNESIGGLAEKMSSLGQKNFICAPKERNLIREVIGPDARFICPGIRLAADSKGDQKRTGGLEVLADSENSEFVVGRALTHSPEPEKALKKMIKALKS